MAGPERPNSFKSTGGVRRIFRALGYSWSGLAAAFRHEAAFRQELFLVVCLTPLAFWLGRSALEISVLLATLLFVLVVELLNSAIETLADAITAEPHPLLGRAKDIGSAAVLLSIAVMALVWAGVVIARIK